MDLLRKSDQREAAEKREDGFSHGVFSFTILIYGINVLLHEGV